MEPKWCRGGFNNVATKVKRGGGGGDEFMLWDTNKRRSVKQSHNRGIIFSEHSLYAVN